MRRFKTWSTMMLVVMMATFVAACSNRADRTGYEEHIDVSPAVGTWLCIKSTDVVGGNTLEDRFVGQIVNIYSNDLYTSTSNIIGTIGSYKVHGMKVDVSTNDGKNYTISDVSFSENIMTLNGSGEGVVFAYVFEKQDTQ